MMKKLFLSLSLLAVLLGFNACSTDVELYADYKDIPVVYGLLDATQDTNFIRINRAFSGSNDNPINANEVALIADSCNYPGKLKAYIVKYKRGVLNNYDPTGDTIVLDTITIHDKEEGLFYAPDQKVYFTTRHLDINTETAKYRYKLFIHKGDDIVTSETGIVGGAGFKILTSQLNFKSEPSDKSNRIMFTLADNAVFYDMKFVFYYEESINGGPFVDKQVSYSFGSASIEELPDEDGRYYYSYGENTLFNMLTNAIGADTVYDENHPNVVRHFRYLDNNNKCPIEIILSAGGDELYNYIRVNSQSGYSQTIPDYTNIMGGYGVFSSRINLTRLATLSARAQSDIYNKPWGFAQQ